MTDDSYSRPLPPGQVPLDLPLDLLAPARPCRDLLLSTLRSLAAGALLLAAFALWSTLVLGLEPAIAGRALLLYGGLALLVLLALPQHLPLRRFGPANVITLLRGMAACWLAALLGQAVPERLAWLPALVAGTALLLDAFDGWVARRGGWSSAFGARFDMECDAFFLAVLSLLATLQDRLGAWVLLAGALRYLFVLAGWRWPWLRRPLAPRRGRKTAYGLMAGVLVATLVPGLPAALAAPAAATVLALLGASFLWDVLMLRTTTAAGESP